MRFVPGARKRLWEGGSAKLRPFNKGGRLRRSRIRRERERRKGKMRFEQKYRSPESRATNVEQQVRGRVWGVELKSPRQMC
jgi:hypothetical protein